MGRDVEVVVKEINGVLQITASSLMLPLNDIQLRWKYKINSNAKYLGDHWERNYGDVAWEKPAAVKKCLGTSWIMNNRIIHTEYPTRKL